MGNKRSNGMLSEAVRHYRIVHVGLVLLSLTVATGCLEKSDQPRVIYGSVSVSDQPVETGHLRFVPVNGTRGPANASTILNGAYRIEGRGGLIPGKYRVEIDARKKTGRKVRGLMGSEMTMVDETVRMGPEIYSGSQSPLIEEITADGDGQIDITISDQ